MFRLNAPSISGGEEAFEPFVPKALDRHTDQCNLYSYMSQSGAPVVHSDPNILSGTPVFVGTRVPAQSLFDYLEGGDTLDEFLRQFPSVRRDQAIAALELARDSVLTSARSA